MISALEELFKRGLLCLDSIADSPPWLFTGECRKEKSGNRHASAFPVLEPALVSYGVSRCSDRSNTNAMYLERLAFR